MKNSLIIFTLAALLIVSFPFVANAISVIEQQTGILYTGAAGQTVTTQKIGTGYTQTAASVSVVAFTGNTSTTIRLLECNSSYASCTQKATTGSINMSGGGTASTTASFTSAYTMSSSSYYEIETTSSDHRLQCGNTSACTPNSCADVLEVTGCATGGETGRSVYFILWDNSVSVIRKLRGIGITR